MSDRIEDVVRACRNVADGTYPCRFGLLPSPKYSKFQTARSGMWSTALDVLLTTLRYLAPATILTLFWGHHHSFFTLLKHIDRAIRTVIFSSNAQKETVLRWLSEASSVQVDDLNTLWKNGWLLCRVLDAALPGACAGHPSGELTLKHAQTLVEQYLGVEPIFTDVELDSTDHLTRNQEWRLAHYLGKVCEAIENLPPAVSKPNSQCNSPDSAFYTLDYAARGLGLSAAQVNNKMHFKLYPTAQQSLDPADITIFIRGPKDAYGMAVVPPVLGKAQQIRQAIINSQIRPKFTENTLPTTLGSTYLRSYGKTDMTKTYHIPRAKYDIEIEVESKSDYIQVDYVVNLEGKYEISITSKGQNVIGSPFLVTASHNILGTLERESFCLEDGEEVDILDVKNDRKVVLRIVDFVTEKMLLREDGALEKITDEEASNLMGAKEKYTDIDHIKAIKQSNNFDQFMNKLRFRDIAIKVALLIRICKVFASNVFDSKKSSKGKYKITKQTQLGIPDIVNSTLNDATMIRPHYKNNNRLKNGPVSSQVEKQKQFYENIGKNSYQSKEKWFEIKDIEKDLTKVNNPFIEELENLKLKRQVSKEDEPIKIIVENSNSEGSSPNTNPFIEPELLERPKTPILKIITGNIQDRDDIFVDPDRADVNDPFCINEFINPFFAHKHHETRDSVENITDFKIGALVSIPPTIQPSLADDKLESIMLTSKEYTNYDKENLSNPNTIDSMAFVSLDSNVPKDLSDIKFGDNSRLNNLCYPSHPSKRDLWDSAYVSIDENNSSPYVTNKDSSIFIDPSKKENQSFSEKTPTYEEFFKLGPAEKELWDSCDEIRQVEQPFDDNCVTRWDSQRLVFTPILEENERSMSAGWNLPENEVNGYRKTAEPEIVAITEQHNVYLEHTLNSGHSSVSYEEQDKSIQSVEVDLSTKVNDVDSASDIISDVKRQTNYKREGKISEVQFDSTESGSASHCLQHEHITLTTSTMSEEDRIANIVWEKKKFWDEKIQKIKEIKFSEQKNIKSPKRNVNNNTFSTKQKPYNLAEDNQNTNIVSQNVAAQSNTEQSQKTNCDAEQNDMSIDGRSSDEKLVDKWKKYWDEKLEHEQQELYESGIRSVSPKFKEVSPLRTFPKSNLLSARTHDNETMKIDTTNSKHIILPDSHAIQTKRDLPDEIMFQAFETSPKRFFGTSRKQILSKIDSFIGKQTNPIQRSTSNLWNSNDKELVSRRVSVFQSISHEEIPFKTSKSKSMNNIHQHSDTFDKAQTMLNKIHDKISNRQHRKLEVTLASRAGSRDNIEMPKLNKEEDLKTLNETPPSDEKSINQGLPINKGETKTDKTNAHKLRKASLCKSEMDIFAKFTHINLEDDFDKYKSCDDLPKINVKSFITLYEQNSSTPEKKVLNNKHTTSNLKSKAAEATPKKTEQREPICEQNPMVDREKVSVSEGSNHHSPITPQAPKRKKRNTINTSQESLESSTHTEREENIISDSKEIGKKSSVDHEEAFDIEVEIVERPEMAKENNMKGKVDPDDYRLRFRSAKQFFQSIEELSPKRNISPKFNECEELLQKNIHESQPKEILKTNELKTKRKKEKSNSVPSSELSEAWKQMKEKNHNESDKFVKISEKFNVDDLFVDVVEGKLSRQGSLRGIPNKKAVLETFRSMENVSNNLSPYDLANKQPSERATNNKLKNAQNYMKEYPYLPVTEPSKYYSRMDTKATGLLTMKELVQKKPRRHSEPEFILNPKFTVNM